MSPTLYPEIRTIGGPSTLLGATGKPSAVQSGIAISRATLQELNESGAQKKNSSR